MPSFETCEFDVHSIPTSGVCLIAGTEASLPDELLLNGESIHLPDDEMGTITTAISRCEALVTEGAVADCGVFGVLASGGYYEPVDDDTYKHELDMKITMREWLGVNDIYGTPEASRLVQFVRFIKGGGLFMRHTAIQLRGRPDTYLQKTGAGFPITITDAETNYRLHGANGIATVGEFHASYMDRLVLEYNDDQTDGPAVSVYVGNHDRKL